MSVAGIPQDHHDHHHPDRNILNKPFHRRSGSGELDVFEAARYFSGYNETPTYNNNGSSFSQKAAKDETRSWRGGRISLDMPIRHVINPQQQQQQQASNLDHKQIGVKVDKKYKQPSSPGGRLASFLNSLFNQSALKTKKKPKPSSTTKDEFEESPAGGGGGGGRRKRRSSISHFQISTTTDSKSIYSSSSSGFRTPPPYAQTPTKTYKDLKTFAKQNTTTNHDGALFENNKEKIWVAMEKYPLSSSSSSSSSKKKQQLGLFRRFDEESHTNNGDDDGCDSDSSSDLFELQNYDLNGLPVYETTNMDNIQRASPMIPSA